MLIAHLIGAAISTLAPAVSAGPLHDAAREGDAEVVQSLIAEGADVNERHRMLGWPLH